MIAAFAKAYPGKYATDLLNVDRVMRQPSKRLAKLHAKGGAGTYLYNFILEFPIQHQKIAWHCSDIPFFFHNTDKVEVCGIQGVSDELEARMFGALMTFARTGRPGHSGLPQWDAVTEEKEPTMILSLIHILYESGLCRLGFYGKTNGRIYCFKKRLDICVCGDGD